MKQKRQLHWVAKTVFLTAPLVSFACREAPDEGYGPAADNGTSSTTSGDPSGLCNFGPGGSYPGEVVDYAAGGAENLATDPAAAEGSPDCGQAEPPDLSLGGGYVVFDLGCQQPTGPGPEIRVWESDESYCSAISESYLVRVSSDGDSYTEVGDGFVAPHRMLTGFG